LKWWGVFRRLRPAGPDYATDIACTGLHEATVVDPGDNARAEELDNLRLALATFALQLDAFEMRTSAGVLWAGAKPENPGLPPDIGCEIQTENMIGRR
jgi:hypothetical protein